MFIAFDKIHKITLRMKKIQQNAMKSSFFFFFAAPNFFHFAIFLLFISPVLLLQKLSVIESERKKCCTVVFLFISLPPCSLFFFFVNSFSLFTPVCLVYRKKYRNLFFVSQFHFYAFLVSCVCTVQGKRAVSYVCVLGKF